MLSITFDDELIVTVNGSTSTQFGQQERQDVLWFSVQPTTNLS